jgi:hypothetical protein
MRHADLFPVLIVSSVPKKTSLRFPHPNQVFLNHFFSFLLDRKSPPTHPPETNSLKNTSTKAGNSGPQKHNFGLHNALAISPTHFPLSAISVAVARAPKSSSVSKLIRFNPPHVTPCTSPLIIGHFLQVFLHKLK